MQDRGSQGGSGGQGRRGARWSRTAGALHVVTLTAFALAQPLFEVLQGGATFFVARRSPPEDVWLFAAGVALLPGLALGALDLIAALVAGRLARPLHLALVALLFAAVAAPPLRRTLEPAAAWSLAPALGIGLVGAAAYARWELARTFLSLLAPAPLVFAGLFLWGPGVRRVAFPRAAEQVRGLAAAQAPSAVVVVLDELGLQALMTPELEIDATLFPNFARLAGASTWLRNATASHESTEVALPAILTGRMPEDPDLLPTAADHPRSVFTMLGDSHRMRTWETFTSVCPPELNDRGAGRVEERPEPLEARLGALARDAAVVYGHVLLPTDLSSRWLPPIDNAWGEFGLGAPPQASESPPPAPADEDEQGSAEADAMEREAKQAAARTDRVRLVREFIQAIDGSPEPTLYLLHVLLPHGPFVHLPSTRSYDPAGLPSDFPGGRLPPSQAVADQQFVRHLLQLGCVDRLLGELFDRLEEVGLFERCALVLVADHGINFAPGEYTRQAFKRNGREIAHVPFFVKRPFQEEARVVDRNVETVDVLPTLLDALGLEPAWPLDGRSALDAGAEPRPLKRVFRRMHPPLELDPALPASWRVLEQKERLFGPRPGWAQVLAWGPAPELVGRRLDELRVTEAADLWARLDEPRRFEAVDPSGAQVPVVVAGAVGAREGGVLPEAIAVALDGVVRAVVEPLASRRPDRARVGALLPEEALTAGAHELELFALRGPGELARIELEPR